MEKEYEVLIETESVTTITYRVTVKADSELAAVAKVVQDHTNPNWEYLSYSDAPEEFKEISAVYLKAD